MYFLGLSKLVAVNPLAPECGRYTFTKFIDAEKL
jgi:hypothetical protein